MLLDQISIHSWINSGGIKTENGKRLDFKEHRYLFDIYADKSKFLCCLKAGQIGFSTMAILKTIWLARYQKMNIGYILPTVEMVQKFVGSKVDPIVEQNADIKVMMKDKDSVYQKKVGEHFIHYLGSQTATSAIMLSLDLLVGDEYDKCPPTILETFDSRLQHSDYGYKWLFSNPTFPDLGVDKFFKLSDQKKWHITHSCGKNYILDESCIDYMDEEYRCPHCLELITDEERRMGEWIATAKGEWSGYWIPLWIVPKITAKVIASKKRNNTAEYFANFVAGLPYINSNDMLTQQVLESNLDKAPNPQTSRVVIGLDTGHNLHYTMMNKEGIFYHGYCKSVAENPTPGYDPYTEIELRLIQYPYSILVADQGGDLIGVRKLQAKYPSRVYLCWFTKETRTKELIRWGEGKELGRVLADRNRVIQLAVDQFNDNRLTINGTAKEWQPWFEHWLNIYRVRELTDENEPLYGWRWVWNRKGADHWALSTVYGLIGMDKFSEDLIQIVRKDDMSDGISTGTSQDGIITARRVGVRPDFN